MQDSSENYKNQLDFEIAFFEALIRDDKNFVDALIPLADAYTKKGLYQKGLEIDKELARLSPYDEGIFYNLACSHALVGNPDEALATLRHSINLGYQNLKHMLEDPDLSLIRTDPRFNELVLRFKAGRSGRAKTE